MSWWSTWRGQQAAKANELAAGQHPDMVAALEVARDRLWQPASEDAIRVPLDVVAVPEEVSSRTDPARYAEVVQSWRDREPSPNGAYAEDWPDGHRWGEPLGPEPEADSQFGGGCPRRGDLEAGQ